MARLSPCPECARHVRLSEGACRFCGATLATTTAPSRLSIALLGLGLAACTSAPSSEGGQPPPAEAGVVPETQPNESQPSDPPPPVEPPSEQPGEQAGDSGAAASTTTNADQDADPTNDTVAGTDAGATIDEPEPMPPPKPKYGAPRPTTKYGGPPKPGPNPTDL